MRLFNIYIGNTFGKAPWVAAIVLLSALLLPQKAQGGTCKYTPESAQTEAPNLHAQSLTTNSNGSGGAVEASVKFNFYLDVFNYDGDPNGYWSSIQFQLDGQTMTFYSDYACTTATGTGLSSFTGWGNVQNGNEDKNTANQAGTQSSMDHHAWFKTASGAKGYIKFYKQTHWGNSGDHPKMTRAWAAVYIYDLYGHAFSMSGTWCSKSYSWSYSLGGSQRATSLTATNRTASNSGVVLSWSTEKRFSDVAAQTDGSWAVSRSTSLNGTYTHLGTTTSTSYTDNSLSCSNGGTTYYYRVTFMPKSSYGTNLGYFSEAQSAANSLAVMSSGVTISHVWKNYASNNDASSTQSGTKTRGCYHCSTTETINDTKSGYSWKIATNNSSYGTVSGTLSNSTLTITATPKSGYHFCGWSDNVNQVWRTITHDHDVNLTASFAAHDYVEGICTGSYCDQPYQVATKSGDWYQIDNAGKLLWFAQQINDGTTINGRLTQDIDLTGVTWLQIGKSETNAFKGKLDGGNHTIKNLSISVSPDGAASLIGYANGATISNLTVEGTLITFGKYAAGFIAVNVGNVTYLKNCISAVAIQSSLKGEGNHGGLVGLSNQAVELTDCAFVGSMTSSTGTTSCAGLIGKDGTGGSSTAQRCYVSAQLTDDICASSLIGNHSGNFSTCYYLTTGGGTAQGNAITETQVKNGHLCYLLNGGKSEGTQSWYQNVDGEGTHNDYPLPYAGIVVYGSYRDCFSTAIDHFSNTLPVHTTEGHAFVESVAAVVPTCTTGGNRAYYLCRYCSGKYYKDSGLHTTEVWDDVTLPASHVNDSCGLCKNCSKELATATVYTIDESKGGSHTRQLSCEVENGIRYLRSFSSETWATWFVPFDLSYSDQISLGMVAAYVESVHEYSDRTVLNVMMISGGKLKAGVPYLVKFNQDVDSIETSSHTLHTAADVQSVSAASAQQRYEFRGNYRTIETSEMSAANRYSLTSAGQMKLWNTEVLPPFRWYIETSDKTSQTSGAPEMRIRVVGEEDFETGIRTLYAEDQCSEYEANDLFDLTGRRQPSGKRGLQIVGGKCRLVK